MKISKNNSNFNLVWNFMAGSKRYFAAGLLFAAGSILADQLDPQIIRFAIDSVLGTKEPDLPPFVMSLIARAGGMSHLRENLWIVAIAIICTAVLRVVCQYAQRVNNSKASETLVKTMRDTLFTHIENLPYAWHMENRTGDIIQRCTSDVETVRNFVTEQLMTVIRICILLVMSIYFMISMNVGLTLIALAPIPFIIVFLVIFRRKMVAGFRKCDEYEGYISSVVQENLTGVRVVRAFGQEKKELDRFVEKNEYYTRLWKNMGKVMAGFWSTQDFLSGLQILLVLCFGAVFCVKGSMTAGEYVAFLSYNAMLVWPIRRLGRVIADMSKAGVSIERIAYIMDSPEEQDGPGCEASDMTGDICFDHVSFSYDGSAEVLHDVSFEIKAGTTLGILGGTGSGKSTLMLLLDKLYDLPEGCGSITIGGRDIRKISTKHLRNNIAMVLQEPFLFSRSIAENIGISREGIDLEGIRRAAGAAQLDDTVMGFSKGYDTFVGERGVTLSGGQKQRAAIARALTADVPIMIFDDSLSAVDTETDAKIRRALEEHFGKSTVIIISHRITTLSKADRIIVLSDGRVAEQGSPQQLRDSGGIFSRISNIQSGVVSMEKEAENER